MLTSCSCSAGGLPALHSYKPPCRRRCFRQLRPRVNARSRVPRSGSHPQRTDHKISTGDTPSPVSFAALLPEHRAVGDVRVFPHGRRTRIAFGGTTRHQRRVGTRFEVAGERGLFRGIFRETGLWGAFTVAARLERAERLHDPGREIFVEEPVFLPRVIALTDDPLCGAARSLSAQPFEARRGTSTCCSLEYPATPGSVGTFVKYVNAPPPAAAWNIPASPARSRARLPSPAARPFPNHDRRSTKRYPTSAS